MPEIINKPKPKETETFLVVTDGKEKAINNTDELTKEIQFLLRTDSRQQWTTDKTPDDWIAFPIFDEEALAFGDEGNRRGLSGILSETVTVILAGENTDLEDNMIENYLYTFSLEKSDENGKPINNPFTLDERDFVISKFIESPYADLIALVCHRDDKSGYEKMYGMFVWTPGKINRIMSVFQNDEEEIDNESYADDDIDDIFDDAEENDSDTNDDDENKKKEPPDVLER